MLSSFWCFSPAKLFRFGNGLSSMQTAAMPAASYFRTMCSTMVASPKPLSQSAMMGRPTTSFMARAVARKSVSVRMLASGNPQLAEISKLDAQMASKPLRSTSLALMPLCAPMTRMRRPLCSRLRRTVHLPMTPLPPFLRPRLGGIPTRRVASEAAQTLCADHRSFQPRVAGDFAADAKQKHARAVSASGATHK